jgi:hypothetical protein
MSTAVVQFSLGEDLRGGQLDSIQFCVNRYILKRVKCLLFAYHLKVSSKCIECSGGGNRT